MNPDLQPVIITAAVGVLLILTAWLATIFERARHQRLEHVCTGCYEHTTDTCGSLCVACRFDAEQATGRAWPVIEAWADENRKDRE